ncbi:MAG: hypothetical protein ACT4OJ_00525 [Bacteroidota bacterium]
MKPILLISIFLIASCKKDIQYDVPCNAPTNDITISRQLFIGNWTWVSELYRDRLTGQTILKTPQTEGYTRQLKVFNSHLEFFKNNSLEGKYLYDFVIESSITNYPDDKTNVLVFKDYNTGIRDNHVHYKICNDTLILNFEIRSHVKGVEKWAKNY